MAGNVSGGSKDPAFAGDMRLAEANPYITAFQAKMGSPSSVAAGGDRGGGGGGGKKLRKFVGYLDAPDGGTRRLYFTRQLDSGVDIPESDIVYAVRLPARRRDGFMPDCVVVKRRADLLFWSKRPMKRPDPQGGGIVGGPFP